MEDVADLTGVSSIALAGVVAHALNSLPELERGDPPCCAAECAPCTGLKLLHLGGHLSDLVRPYLRQAGTGVDWWTGDVNDGTVDWDWVRQRICLDVRNCTAPGRCIVREEQEEETEE